LFISLFRISRFRFRLGNKIHHQKIFRLIFQRHELQNLRLFLQQPFAVLAGLVVFGGFANEASLILLESGISLVPLFDPSLARTERKGNSS
jgi:hypothetical protein